MRFLRGFLLIVVLAFAVLYAGVPLVDRCVNRSPHALDEPPPHPPIADMHSDVLLWNRDITEASNHGHVDLPRLRRGGTVLQVFSATNSFPLGANYRRSPDGPDLVALLALCNRWPESSWRSPWRRALVQAATLHAVAARSPRDLVVVTHATALDTLGGDGAPIAGILSIEGLHGLDGSTAPVDSLFAAGFRIFGLVHMTDTDVAGSATGWNKGGLTRFGRRVVAHIDSLGGIIDLAHASPQTIADVLAAHPAHIMVSHTGVTATCPGNRNLNDAQLRAIANAGGIVGIGFWKRAVCGSDRAAIARAMRHAADVMGVEHVAIGSDFDGAVATPFDAAHTASIIPGLRAERFTNPEIELIMAGNARHFLSRSLPRD